MSILDFARLKALLNIPEHVTPVAYLCIGYVSEFRPQPDLEEKGWEQRESLARVTHANIWSKKAIRPENGDRAARPKPQAIASQQGAHYPTGQSGPSPFFGHLYDGAFSQA